MKNKKSVNISNAVYDFVKWFKEADAAQREFASVLMISKIDDDELTRIKFITTNHYLKIIEELRSN